VITDEELLSACRSAGTPGSDSHRAACRLYRQSVLEYRARTSQGRRGQADRAALRLQVALIATAAIEEGWLDCAGCGTHAGYARHASEGSLACPACLKAESGYSGGRKRERRQARERFEQAHQEAA
jgi:hypothetical protein